MSMFICARCDNLRDSDEGCEEYKRTQLICMDCVNDMEAAEADKKKYSYAEIYDTLIAQGCEPDIARELARENSR